MSGSLGVWPVRIEAERLAATLAQRLGGDLFRPWEREEPQKAQLRAIFRQRSQWVLVMATGIATRFVAALLQDKHQDPAVVVVDEAGRYAVALVGGHEGGANALTYRIANAIGAVPVVTTATEATRALVVGIGCRKGVSEQQIEQAIRHALLHLAGAVREVATVDLKAQEPGLLAYTLRHGIPLRIIAKQEIQARAWVGKSSEWVQHAVGLDGVCEPCALIASPRGRLVVPKTALDGVAVAVVEDEWGLIS